MEKGVPAVIVVGITRGIPVGSSVALDLRANLGDITCVFQLLLEVVPKKQVCEGHVRVSKARHSFCLWQAS